LADQNYEKYGEYTSIVYNEQEYRNLEILKAANRFSNGLRQLGIQPGDRILVMLLNSPEIIISYQAILRAGGIIIPVIFLLGPPEVAHILKNSEAKVIITTKAFIDNIKQAAEGVSTLEQIIIVEDEDVPGTITYASVAAGQPDTLPEQEIKTDDTAVILYTSGTTGVPKGVELTHNNLYFNADSSARTHHPKPEDIGLFFLPLSHTFGVTMMNVTMMYPMKAILMPWFDLEGACQLIEKHRVYGFSAVPAIFTALLNTPQIVDKYDLSSLRVCACGSAPLPLEILKGFEKKFGCIIQEGYGLSEASPVVAVNPETGVRKTGSVGQALPDVIVKILDDKGVEMPCGEIGEITVKGPNVSPGYYHLPAETAETFRDGWLHTGDLGFMDEEDYIFIVDRKKDLIIRGGFNIVPRDVEEILYTHPAVSEAVVIGVPDQRMGEEIKAYIIPREEAKGNITAEEIITFCQEYLAKYKTPKYVEFVDTLPRNPIGKILRKDLRKMNQDQN
jgi:long-chain acyl-CoA synthetase